MSQISGVLEKLEGTSACEVLIQMEKVYLHIYEEQAEWYKKTNFTCPQGCGSCCRGFEPDIHEGEALYMAAWLLENQNSLALKIADNNFPFNYNDGTCPFFNSESPFHCSIYGGRAFICRLFGASSYSSRNGDSIWRPCKFYPEDKLALHKPPLQKRQYSSEETIKVLGALPPLISDMTEEAVSESSGPGLLIHQILPQKIRWLLWLISMNDNGNDNPNGTPSPVAA
ncbi:YkgJ family cysteine cluster protein [Treponema sp.]|uniref:YkgJ family cysteine cluster protein n=1 Tax=Treponema sp. TaxID=166 RepID=UPI0025DB55C7|nr:YkgJ family cysteine cluster protein [Treponema sp.]MCR5219294.1 YkgJ family cysteine cluster protein [Treponema sp.]